MIKLIQASEAHLFPELIGEMYRLRARQFNDRLGWRVEVKNGKERDQFDNLNPLYVISVDENGNVIGTLRLLQTTGPHMLSDVFPQLLPDNQMVRSPLIWESTRFCVDTQKVKDKPVKGLNTVTGELLSALLEIGLYAGLTHIVTVIDVRMERILLRAACPVERLGSPVKIGKVPSLAILMECSEATVNRVHIKNNIANSCIKLEDARRLGMAA